MTENERELGDTSQIIKRLQTGKRPLDQFLALTITQVYQSGQYRYGVLSNQAAHVQDLVQTCLCVRMVARQQ